MQDDTDLKRCDGPIIKVTYTISMTKRKNSFNLCLFSDELRALTYISEQMLKLKIFLMNESHKNTEIQSMSKYLLGFLKK